MSNLDKFYKKLKSVPSNLVTNDKYVFLIKNNILKAKYIHASDIFNIDSAQLKTYVFENEKVLVFPISIDNKLISLFIKGIDTRSNPLKVNATHIPYGIDLFSNNFRYGDPIIIVEGIADLGAMKLLDPTLNVIAMLSNSLSKEACNFINKLTNNFVVITDNDKAGEIGFNTLRKRLEGSNVRRVENYSYLDDPGNILDLLITYKKTKDTFIKNELNIIKDYYINKIKEG